MNSGAELRRGRLENGNFSGDFLKARRCGARNRQGKPCHCPAMRGKRRCRQRGGKSTGARTKAGIHRIRAAHWKDGRRSARLLAEAKIQSAEKELELFKEMTWDYDATTNLCAAPLRKAGLSKNQSPCPAQVPRWTTERVGRRSRRGAATRNYRCNAFFEALVNADARS